MIKIEFWNTLWPIIVAIIVFGVIIFIHEFGHFIFAKLFKIRVNEFAIGFGPALFKFKKGETQYALRVLPLGGFCAMDGEDGESDDEHAFSKAKVWQRIIVCAAGAVFNIILGFFLLLAIVGLQSDRLASTTISKFDDNAVSCKYGLQVGDTITKIDGRYIFSSDDLSYMLSLTDDGVIDMQVERKGKTVELKDIHFNTVDFQNHTMIDRDFYVYPIESGFFGVIKEAAGRTLSLGRYIFMTLADLLTGRLGFRDMSGPVGITNVMSKAVSSVATNGMDGFIGLMRILALITINLGVFNLLPIPALDGSRIMFLIIEGVRRKPIPPKKEGMVHAVGMAILLAFMAVIIVKDVWSLF